MGSYLECLLDAGELPAFGTVGGGGDQICNEAFESFSLANGRPPKEGLGAGKNQNKDSDKDREKNNNLSPQKDSGRSAGGATRSPREHRTPGLRRTSGADGSQDSAEGSKETAQDGGSSQFLRFSGGGGQSGRAKRRRVEGVSGVMAAEQEKEKKKEEKVRKVSSASDETNSKDVKKFFIRKPDKTDTLEDQEEPWSIGKIFRWAIIIMILVAIILFLINQARQISKSMEK